MVGDSPGDWEAALAAAALLSLNNPGHEERAISLLVLTTFRN
jgi:hypothetical protein